MYFSLSMMIASMNLAKAQSIDSFKMMNTSISVAFLIKLEDMGIMSGFEMEPDKLCVYMKYVNSRVPFVHMHQISKPSSTYSVTIDKLSKLVDSHGSSVFVLSTGYGFLSHSECFAKSCSGELVAKMDL